MRQCQACQHTCDKTQRRMKKGIMLLFEEIIAENFQKLKNLY